MVLDRVEEAPKNISAQKRRFWSADAKQRIVAETMEPDSTMAEVARRHGVNPNLLFTWRRQAKRKASADAGLVELVPVVVAPEPAAPVSRVEIVLVGGERILVDADVDAGALARIVRALSRR
ncbi:MAG: transposase [Hyphomicrobiales bacterium]|nr:transposase [Hyphomicrobiales bacterium]